MTEPPGGTRSVAAATVRYTLLRVAVLLGCLAVALAVVLPLTGGEPLARRVLVAGLAAAVASVPLSLLVGRRRRAELAGALAEASRRRRAEAEDYAARVRAGREGGAAGPSA